ncbi:time for coffee [Thalictrum thalictroides]|uniref:Time for coffee n=1 Tax=Thalictrum thalictroides TaxID=46969 RepID=A0A7J6VHJ0_THATH|nr:time for coffee [Thalictrum thalictroides]
MQAQSPQSASTTPNSTGTPNIGYYQQRRQPQENQQQQPGSSSTASSGMLSLCPPLTLSGTTTSDPTKAVAAAANMKGGLPPQGLLQAAQFATQSGGHPFMSTAFPYIHSVPAVQVKPAEQKQPAGNDNLHACWQPEKR